VILTGRFKTAIAAYRMLIGGFTSNEFMQMILNYQGMVLNRILTETALIQFGFGLKK